ncbi:YrvL family regulatory protein [[Clostridium] dakarense]|uniref:YrvL family regulatory protein n=1 Tax=Faecalimicrobium dakarense TaxID=1301100 RepID=UPI0004AC9037|nr:YrvL family regulatory protein [[Clostridium] dakarense]
MESFKKTKDTISMVVAGSILLAVIFVLTFVFGGILLSLLGFEYDSLSSLAKFFIIYVLIGLPLDLVVECFFRVLKDVKGLTNTQRNALYFTIDVPLNMIIIGVLESTIDGISCSILTAFLFSVICCLFGFFLDKK